MSRCGAPRGMEMRCWPAEESAAMKSRAVKGVYGQKQGTGTKFPAENNSSFLWLAWRETRSLLRWAGAAHREG
jgi:hypothetical protein